MSSEVSSTPVSVRAMSTFSDIESVVSLTDHNHSNTDPVLADNVKMASNVHPEFAFPDGNIEIKTMNHSFWVHEYHLNKFSAFAALIQEAKTSETTSDPGSRAVVVCDEKTKGEDVYNTLKVIYANHIDGIPDFDSSTMISTLRIASTFGYPTLRKFAISKLEEMSLPAIQRVQLSDEFLLPSWETPAFAELCSRKEPISSSEAEVLGMSRFVEIARIRETKRARDCCASESVKGLKEDMFQAIDLLLKPDGPDDGAKCTEDDLEYLSGRSVLPAKCSYAPQGPFFKKCNVHRIASLVLKEGQTLFQQRTELLEQLANIRSTVDGSLECKIMPSNSETLDLEVELSRASWIRKEEATTL